MRNYSFRRVTPDDLALLHQWLDMPHVKMWWGNASKQVALIKQDMENTKIDMHMVELVGHPFAYIHHHDAFAFGMPEYADLPPATRVIGTFVGNPEYLGQGHAAGYIEAFLKELRLHYPLVAVSANTTDMRTLGTYKQAGFRKRRLAATRDGKLVQVMTHV